MILKSSSKLFDGVMQILMLRKLIYTMFSFLIERRGFYKTFLHCNYIILIIMYLINIYNNLVFNLYIYIYIPFK